MGALEHDYRHGFQHVMPKTEPGTFSVYSVYVILTILTLIVLIFLTPSILTPSNYDYLLTPIILTIFAPIIFTILTPITLQ